MNNLEKYIKEILDIELKLKPLSKEDQNRLPLFLRNNLSTGKIREQDIIFVLRKKKENLTPDQYKKQAEIIENNLEKHVVFVLGNLVPYNRNRLIRKKVAFIEPDRQMYIPFLFIDIKEYGKSHTRQTEKFSPAAQCLLFYYLLGNNLTGLNFKSVAEKLKYGTMTVTRAVDAFVRLNLCKTEGGREKYFVFEKSKDNIWREAQSYLINPVDKYLYTDDNVDFTQYYLTDINALAHYTEIAEEEKNAYAISKKAFQNIINKSKIKLIDSPNANTAIQVWKYDPGLLTSNNIVDPLSLYITLKDNANERVHGELNKMISGLW